MYLYQHSLDEQRATLESELRYAKKEASRLAARMQGDRSLYAYYSREQDRLRRHLNNLELQEGEASMEQ